MGIPSPPIGKGTGERAVPSLQKICGLSVENDVFDARLARF